MDCLAQSVKGEFDMKRIILAAIASVGFAAIASAQMAPTKTGDSAKGKVLTDPKEHERASRKTRA